MSAVRARSGPNPGLILRTLFLVALAMCLSACADGAQRPGYTLLEKAIDLGTHDTAAEDLCEGAMSGTPLVAALDSAVADVHDLAGKVTVRAGWDDGMPADDDHYAAICLYNVKGTEPLGADYDYMALWASTDEATGGSAILTLWR